MMEFLTPYKLALASMALLAILNALQGLGAGALKSAIEQQPVGQPPAGDYNDLSFRVSRVFLNGVENLPASFPAAFLAILVGGAALWVNWICLSVLVSRLVYTLVYYARLGGPGFGIRSVLYFLMPMGTILLGILTLIAIVQI